MSDSNNYELIFKKNSANRPSALYNTTNIIKKTTIKPGDVLDSVYSQIKTIQQADGNNSKFVGKLLNGVKKSSFMSVNKLPVYHEIPHPTNKFETQCVSDTQLINIIEDAEALINTRKGITQEFDNTFAHTNIDDRNSDVTLSDDKTDRKNNRQLKFEITFNQSNVDETVLFLHDRIERGDNNLCIETHPTQLDVIELDRDVFKLKNVDTLRKICDKVIKENKFSERSLLHSSKCIENHCREASSKLKDRDSHNRVIIDAEIENADKMTDNIIEANHALNLNDSLEIDNNHEERSPSPILKMETKCKITKMPSPLVVTLESFETFERLALPHINIHNDFDTCKHLINSQILRGELCLNTDEDVMFNHNGQLSPILERSCETVQGNAEKLIEINNLKDEILFSSDEENDYIHREFQDLPLTAALETSFNDHSNVLEETIYVGFQTASNKSIQICTELFHKAQYMLDEDEKINDANFNLSKLVDICDEKNFNNLSSADLKLENKMSTEVKENKNSAMTQVKFKKLETNEQDKMIDDSKKKVSTVTDYDDIIKKPPEKQTFVGFKTASNKKIDLSEKALDVGKKVFIDIDFDEKNDLMDQDNLELISEETNAVAKVNLETNLGESYSKNYIEDKMNNDLILQKLENIEMSLEEKETSLDEGKIINFHRFKTASNINTVIPEAAEANVKNIFQNLGETNKKSEEFDPMSRKHTEKIHLPNKSTENNFTPEATMFIGFKTANNKNIKISDQALAKTKNVFHDIDYENNKPVECQPFTNKTAFIGFKTANIKDSKISEVALSKSSTIFKDIENDLENPNSFFEGFKTASSKRVNISKQALLKSRKIFQDMDRISDSKNTEDLSKNCKDNASFSALKTANNKAVTVYEESIAGSKKLFEDLVTNMGQNPIDSQPCKYDPKDQKHTFKGFQTASKKPLSVSVHALERSKNIFQDIDYSVSKINTFSESKFKGFQTASNQVVAVSNEALDASKKLLDELIMDESRCSFTGFKTASNKNVKISEEALAKCKKIFDNLEDSPTKNLTSKEISKKPFGFQTANNKLVEISKEALEKTKALFNDIEFQEQGSFKGFQTASKKKVDVSKVAMEKSKALFNDIEPTEFKKHESISGFQTATQKSNKDDENIDLDKNGVKLPQNSIFQFRTANNKNTNISKDALKYSRKLLEDTNDAENDRNKTLKQNDQQIDYVNLENIIDTQVLDNFKETLCTEDFKETPRNNKRSGSPILSCPRAKKRKRFETPYKNENNKKTIDFIKIVDTKNTTGPTKIKLNENYKKNKIYTLNDLTKFDNDKRKYIDPYISNFNLHNILNFEFISQRNELTDSKVSIEELKKIFLSAVNRILVPEGWLDNHLKLILWKLLSYEIRFPNLSVLCTIQNVLDQLKYRYDKELYNAERPALRKIFEKDDVPTKSMVLCVAGIYIDGVSVSSVTWSETIELLLTDGWYFIKATIDKMLCKFVCDGRMFVGCKIVTSGAELANCEQGVAPWEDTSAVRLKLFGNSTRPAPWDAKLGYTRAAILSHLSSVKVDGGKISRLRVFAARVYPLLYVEKFEDGSTVTRSERLELLHQIKYEAERELMMERIYEDVQKEFSDQDSQDSQILCSGKRKYLDSGSQISKVMKRSKDPMEFRAQLTSSQVQLLEGHTCKYREKILQAIQNRIEDKLSSRNVVTLARVRIAAVQDGDNLEITKGMLSIWKPNDAILELFKEGSCIEIMNVVPTAIRYSEIQITAGRQSVFRPTNSENKFLPHLQSLKRTCFKISDVALNPSMTTDYNEIDTVGIVFLIEPSNREFESHKNFQNAYLADANKNIICVNFWGGLKKFGFENILDTGQVVACANLQKRAGNTRKNIPQFRVTEFTFFTKTPKNVQAREMVDDVNKKLFGLDRRKFCDDCIAIKNNYAAIRCLNNNENESPYRFNKSDYSFARNKMFIDTPFSVKTNKNEDMNLNLTGLDFESTFKQDTQDLSPRTLLRKKKVNEKIARLKMYGEPPRLSPMNIVNKSENAKNSYKSPLTSINSSIATLNPPNKSASTINKLPEESPKTIPRSPVNLTKRFSVRSVPVKLNFADENKNELIDHFAEEFDASPPLSLD